MLYEAKTPEEKQEAFRHVYETNPRFREKYGSFEDFLKGEGLVKETTPSEPGVMDRVGVGAKALRLGLWDAAMNQLPATVARVYRAGDVGDPRTGATGLVNSFIDEQTKDTQGVQGRLSPQEQNQEVVPGFTVPFTDFKVPPITGKDILGGVGNLGYSAPSMIAGLGAGALAAESGPGAIAAASATAGAVGGVIGYRATKDQFVQEATEHFLKQRPKSSEQDVLSFQKSIEPLATEYGLWEAGPEAVSQAVTAGLIKLPVADMLSKVFPALKSAGPAMKANIMGKVASGAIKTGADLGEELATETVTQKNQGRIEAEVGTRDKAPTWGESFQEVYPQVVPMVGVTMGAGGLHNMALERARARRQAAAESAETGDEGAQNTTDVVHEATAGIDSVVSELKGEQPPQGPAAPFQDMDAHDPVWNLRRLDLSARHVPGQPTVSDYFNPAIDQALAKLRDASTDHAPFAPVDEGMPLWNVRRIIPENSDLSSLVAPSPLDQALEKIRAMNAAQERDRFNANLPATDHERAIAPVGEETSVPALSGLAQLQPRRGLPYGGQDFNFVPDNARRDLPVPSTAIPMEGRMDVGEMPPSERLAPSLPGVDRLQALADAAKTTPRVTEDPLPSPVTVSPEPPSAVDGLILDKSGKPFKDKTINLAVAQAIKRGRNVEAFQIGPNQWGMRPVEDVGPNSGSKHERASIETALAAVQGQGYDAMRDRAEELIDSGENVDVVYDVLAGMEERATPKSEVGATRWDIFPIIDDKGTRHVGDITQPTADEINSLGFKTKPSRAVLRQENVDYIEKQHGDQLKPKDVELLRDAVSNPSEVLPNIPTQTGPGRADRVLLVKQNGKAHVAIVEMSADESDNTVLNFWKMDKKTAEAYLKKYREEKVKRQSNLGGRPNVPSIAPTSSSEDGSPVGLSGGQVDAASEGEITTSNSESKDDSPEKLDLTLGEKIGGSRKDTAEATGPRVSIAGKDDGVPSWKKRFTASRVVEADFRNETKGSYWSITDSKGKLPIGKFKFSTKEEAEAAIPLAAVSLKHRVVKNKDAWGIDRKVTDRKYATIKDGFATEDEAKRYMATHAEEILDTKTGYGEEILAKPEKVMREGVPRREGPASGQDFLDTFGFRGVEFGKWNDQFERQEVLNHAYDGLLDLADILDVPAKALSLNGELALAFGARGRGLSSAKAHYERDYAVINLTKMTGAGSLAHEWFHALDHYLARQDGKASSEKITNERGDMVFKAKTPLYDFQSHGESRRSSKMSEELRKAYNDLMHAMTHKAEQFKEDTEKAERFVGRARGYLEKELQNIRVGLAREVQWGKKKAPATAEQLARFDTLADQLLSGDNLTLEMRDNDAGGKRRSRFGSYRNSNDVIDGLAAIYKEVRGRSGFNVEKNGPFNTLAAYVRDYAMRAKMLADARAETEKTKQVPTQFRQDAHVMDRGRTTDYWSEPHELAARAFSAYVEDKAQENGGRSDFLVYGANNDMPAYKLFNVRPFPEGTEREAINTAFDKFFQTVKTKETEHGVMMYQRRAEDREKASPAVTLEEARGLLQRSGLSSLAEAYESMEMMPKAIQDVLHATNGEEEPAFFHGGKLYFNLAHTQDRADLARSIAHEIIHPGEGAFARKLGLRMGVREAQISLNNIKDRIFHDYRKEIQTLLTEYGYSQDYDIRTLEGRRGIVGELLATRSETFAPRWYDKVAALVARIVNGVRAKMGLGPMRFTEAEMRELIGGIRAAFAEEHSGVVAGAGEMAPAFQRVSPDATDKLQTALEYGRRVVEATKAWSKVVDDAVSGKANPRAILRIGETPDMLVGFGLPRLPMVMDKSTLDKMLGAKAKKGHSHDLTVEQIKDLYRHLADPVGFVREASRNAVVLTEMDEDGKSIIVPIQVSTSEGNIKVNAVASAYGKNSIGNWMARHAADGKLIYLDKKRAAALKDMSGNQLSRVLQARLQSGKKLLTEGDVVKPVFQDSEDSPKYQRVFQDENGELVSYRRRTKPDPEKTVVAYKLFRMDAKRPGELFPLFVDANTPVEQGVWLDAEVGPQTDTGKVKSRLGPLAFRPGWHAGDLPLATHIGLKRGPHDSKPSFRNPDHVWAEVEMAADHDWQNEANKRGVNARGKFVDRDAHITDQPPEDGYYRYKTNSNMTGNWLIGGSMKVNRILSDAEVERINAAAGVADLPRKTPLDLNKFGFEEQVSSPLFRRAAQVVSDPSLVTDLKGELRNDLYRWQKALSLPHWIAKQYPKFTALYDRQLARVDERLTKVHDAMESAQSFYELPKTSLEEARKVIWALDGQKVEGLGAWSRSDGKFENGRTRLALEDEHYIALERHIKDELEASGKVAKAVADVRRSLDQGWVDLYNKFASKKEAADSEIANLRSQMGKIHNYFPHKRYGDFYIRAVDQEGTTVYREHFDMLLGSMEEKRKVGVKRLRRRAEEMVAKLAEKYPGYSWKYDDTSKLPEAVYEFPIPVDALQQIVNAGTDKLPEGSRKDVKNALDQAFADVLKERGFGSSFIQRQNVPGHEMKDVRRVFHDHLTGLYGFLTKMDAARDFTRAMRDIDARREPRLYEYAQRYMQDMLQNAGKVDQTVSALKAIGFVKYLGLRLPTAAINLTQNIISGIPVLSMHTKSAASRYFWTTAKDLLTFARYAMTGRLDKAKGLTPDEAAFLKEAYASGHTQAAFVEDMQLRVADSARAKAMQKILQVAGWPMAVTERFNRATLALAAYRAAREGKVINKQTLAKFDMSAGQPATHEQASAFARMVTDDAHFVYDKGNMPQPLRGTDMGKLASTSYQFRRFSHNMISLYAEMMRSDRGKQAMLRHIGGLVALGGLASVPLYRTMLAAIMHTTGDDGEELLRRMGVGDLIIYGLPSLAGLSFSGSMGMDIPVVSEMADKQGNPIWDLLGIPGAFVRETQASAAALRAGRPDRALATSPLTPSIIRNAANAIRLDEEGARTLSGRPIPRPGDRQAMKLTKGQTWLKALGFQPMEMDKAWRVSESLEAQKEFVQEAKSAFASRYVNALNAKDVAAARRVLKEVQEWNARALREKKRHMVIDLKAAVRSRMQPVQPPKQFRARAKEMVEGRQ